MSEEVAFLSAVIDRPDDDTLRLVYADWLQERGDPRAEFIRVQVALARAAPDDPHLGALRSRERELLDAHAHDWCAPHGLEPERCEFRRGFVEAVDLRADEFLKDPETVFRSSPVRRARFSHATDHVGALADCPWLARLSALDLSANAIRDAGVTSLVGSPHLTGLVTLDLSGCEIHTEGAVALAGATNLSGLRELRLAGCGIKADGLRALLQSPALRRVTVLDVRGNYQCWVSPNADELWVTLTETNIDEDGVRLLAESPESARLTSADLSLNQVGEAGWDALARSSHLGAVTLNVFESDYEYPNDPAGAGVSLAPAGPVHTPNEELSDALCLAIPGGRRKLVPRQPIDPRWDAPPCTIEAGVVRRLREKFGPRVTFSLPEVRYGALFSSTRADWFGMRAVLDPPAG
jgi:uncharacterized protein (TIGR02996 family)